MVAIWLGSDRRDLPGECGAIVELEPGIARLGFTDAGAGTTAADVSADGLAPDLARELARSVAPLRDAGAGAHAAGIPQRVGLAALLGRREPDADWVESRWSAPGNGGLSAILGAGAKGPVTVDLRADGPHGLVAGTTGAGKSELLQTLIASLAVTHAPDRLTFLLVDYKGGAAFKDCVALPHTVGLVTDLDGHLAERALRSLNAELRRRERLLRDAGAKDLHDLERRDPASAPPSLLIVVDEFATLAREVPEFIDGVVDVAQRGRSLGVHLLLATQRPGGVVSDNIRANTNLRVALRVSEAAESTDVVGVADAARIGRDRPGRAYVRTGHAEVAELQTAFVGGPVATAERRTESVTVRPLRFEAAPVADRAEPGADTELSVLVDACVQAAERLGLERPRAPWLPPLEPIVPLASLPRPEGGDPSAVAVLGLLDEPGEQRQRPWTVDLESEGSLLVYGASGTGKTALLRLLAVSLAHRASPTELHLYGLDFATRGLHALEALPHCGSVIGGDDEERTARLFARLRAELERRKLLLARRGVFSLSEYRASTDAEPLPRILVLLDGYAGFAAAFERVNLGELVDALPRLVGDGRPLGLHFAITADRRAALPNALAGIVPAKVVLRMADDDELAALGVPLKTVRGMQLPPGRGFLPGGTELQVALPGNDPTGEGQAAAVAEAAAEAAARWPGAAAPPIEPMPTRVELASLDPAPEPLAAALGLGDAELAPVTVDLSERHLLVAGPYRSGRSTALATLAGSLRASTPGVELHLLAPRRSPLVELELWDSVAAGHEDCDRRATELAALVEARDWGRPAARRRGRRRGRARGERCRAPARDRRPARPRPQRAGARRRRAGRGATGVLGLAPRAAQGRARRAALPGRGDRRRAARRPPAAPDEPGLPAGARLPRRARRRRARPGRDLGVCAGLVRGRLGLVARLLARARRFLGVRARLDPLVEDRALARGQLRPRAELAVGREVGVAAVERGANLLLRPELALLVERGEGLCLGGVQPVGHAGLGRLVVAPAAPDREGRDGEERDEPAPASSEAGARRRCHGPGRRGRRRRPRRCRRPGRFASTH